MMIHMNKTKKMREMSGMLKFFSIFSVVISLLATSAFSDYSTQVKGKVRSVNQSHIEITGYHITWQVALSDLSNKEVDRVKSQIATQKEIEVWVPASRLKYRVEYAPSDQDRLPAGTQGWSNYL